MPSTRLLLLAIGVTVLLAAVVIGAAVDVLRQSFRGRQERTSSVRTPSPTATPQPLPAAVKRPDPNRYTPSRTRLKWYSPEIAAALLLALAAGLWLARLAG
ncbi:MAG: hypothetical protein ACYDCQ_11240 [Dehalococcoidia bacterium]